MKKTELALLYMPYASADVARRHLNKCIRRNRELLEALEATGWAFWIHWLTPFAGGADWEVFGRALIPVFDLPKTITTTVFTLYDAPFAQVDSHGFNGSFRLSYMLGNFFLCCIRFFLKVFQYGHFFQSAIQSAIFCTLDFSVSCFVLHFE
mgnify:CR=1 FL=1